MKRPNALRLLAVACLAVLAACAPSTLPGAGDDVLADLERTAHVIYHRMELGYLEEGVYTTNVLIDLRLPEGARWTLRDFANDGSSYVLELTSTRVDGAAFQVSPRGVRRTG